MELGREHGFFSRLSDRHMVVFAEPEDTIFDDRETVLFVSFAKAGINDVDLADLCPLGTHMRKDESWAHLCIIACDETWYRDTMVYGFFDRLVDEGFFEDFDRVIFYGAGMGGYGAAAFSVTAPGASVLLFAPQATLNPEIAEWDDRHLDARRLNFTTRYGYAPQMTEAAERVIVIYDPMERLDAMHAALFQGVFTTRLPLRFSGPDPEATVTSSGVMPELVRAVSTGRFDRQGFYRLMRARRKVRSYLRRVAYWAEERDRPVLTAVACRSVLSRMKGRSFSRKLAEMREIINTRGLTLPDPVVGDFDAKDKTAANPICRPPEEAA